MSKIIAWILVAISVLMIVGATCMPVKAAELSPKDYMTALISMVLTKYYCKVEFPSEIIDGVNMDTASAMHISPQESATIAVNSAKLIWDYKTKDGTATAMCKALEQKANELLSEGV